MFLHLAKGNPKTNTWGGVFPALTKGRRLDLGMAGKLAPRQGCEAICQALQCEMVYKTTGLSLLGLP